MISKLGNPLPQTVLVVRSLPGLGDWLCSTPALRALRTALPQARITLLGLPGTEGLVQRFSHLIDDWLAFPGFPGIPEGWQGPQAIPPFLTRIQAQPFDLVLQMQGDGSYINSFVALLGAKALAGFYLPGQYCPNPDSFLLYPNDQPEIRRHLRLMAWLGVSLQGEEMEFPLSARDRLRFKLLAVKYGLKSGKFVCLHAGASVGSRRWAATGFAQVADRLAELGYAVVLTGTAAETEVTQAVQREMRSPAVNLTGQTDLGSLGAVLAASALLVCNDTGVSHLAAALSVPSVVIFSDSDPQRWAPLDRQRHREVCQHSEHTLATVIDQAKAQLLERAHV